MSQFVDHSERIAEIQELLRAGVTSVSVDGTTVHYDLEALRRELRSLMAEDDLHRHRRPRIGRLNLSSAWQ